MFKQVTLLLCLLMAVTVAQAARLNTLFEAEVGAAGRGTAQRDAALSEALAEVLVRLTGSRAVLSGDEPRKWLAAPGRFVQQFRFKESGAAAGSTPELTLWVQFDGVALARELRTGGLPYWGKERPDLLVWLAVDDSGRRYLVAESAERLAANTLRRAGVRYGLPLTLPLLDLEDQRAIQFTDVWGGFSGTIEAASVRYRPQLVLTGRLERAAGGGWRADWQLLDGGAGQSWRAHGAGLAASIDNGIGDAAEWLALRYAAVAADSSQRTLLVEGVQSLSDYARVSDYLASLSPVERVEVLRAGESEVEYALTLGADERTLLQIITLGKILQSQQGPDSWRFHLKP